MTSVAVVRTEALKMIALSNAGSKVRNDLRKAGSDGWAVEHELASDLQPGNLTRVVLSWHSIPDFFPTGFWECGHELFRSTSESFPVAFVPGGWRSL